MQCTTLNWVLNLRHKVYFYTLYKCEYNVESFAMTKGGVMASAVARRSKD